MSYPLVLNAEGDAPAEVRPRRRNRWAIALWIISGVLVVLAVADAMFAARVLFSVTSFNDSAADLTQREWAQLGYVILPGLFTAGVLSSILAVALHAHESFVRARAVAPAAAQTAAPAAPVTPGAPVTPAAPVGTAAVAPLAAPASPPSARPAASDYSQYMRPPADAG